MENINQMCVVISHKFYRYYLLLFISFSTLLSCGGGGSNGNQDPLASSRPEPAVHQKSYQWVNPVPPDINYFGMTSAGNSTFAVGELGTIIKTKDGGNTWESIYTGTSMWLFDITWNGSTYVAVGSNGTILSSSDGNQWAIQDSGTTFGLRKVHWTGSQFLVVGRSQTMLSSADGIIWHKYDEGSALNDGIYLDYNDVTTGNGQHVMVATNGFIFYSADSITWNKANSPLEAVQVNGYAADFFSVSWTGTDFIAVGEQGIIVTSQDGINWQRRITNNNRALYAVGVSNGVVVIAGRFGTILTTHDFENWTTTYSGTDHIYTLSVTNEMSTVFYKIIALSNNGNVSTTFDRVNWSLTKAATGTPFLSDAVWNGSRFVIVGGAVLTSQDGVSWQNVNTSFCCLLNSVTWSGASFVAVGWSGVITSSSDGLSWQTQTSGIKDNLNNIVWNGNQYLAVGDNGAVLTSDNGINWTAQNSGFTGNIKKLTWNGSRYVAIGVVTTITSNSIQYYDSYVLTSTNGTNWQIQSFNDKRFHGMVWTGSQYVIVGDTGLVLSSLDGDNWSYIATGINMDLVNIDWVGGLYIIRQSDPVALKYTIYTGSSLNNLSSMEMPVTTQGVVSDNQKIYLYGVEGNIFYLINR